MKRGGYMLLEVVLALSIFVVAVVGLLRSLNAGLDADYEQRRLTTLRLNLQNLLDETLAVPPREAGTTEVPEDVFHVRYRREIRAEKVKLAGGREVPDLYRVTVQALDARKDNRVIGELWTYVGK